MSNPIEFIARQAQAGLTGVVNPAATAAEQDARGGELIRNMAVGGLSLGAGTGALVALVNYLKSMKEESEVEDETRLNDDTLYIPATKMAADGGANRWLAPGLAVTGGILSAGGAYALTQAVYNHLQKKRRQKMLDEAQGETLLASDEEIAKAAAAPSAPATMGLFDLLTSLPVAVPLLAALATGGVSYAALKKTFPTVKSPKSKYPRRIRQVTREGEVQELPEELEDDIDKSASESAAEADIEDAAMEFLILTVDQMSCEKAAKFRLTSDILHRVAREGLGAVTTMQKQAGMPALVESVKGASEMPVCLVDKVMAAAAICKSARLRPVVTALAAAEFQEMAPDLYETALSYGEEHLDKFAGLAPLLQLAYFRPLMLDKSAATGSPLPAELVQMLQQLLQGRAGGENLGAAGASSALTSDVTGSGADDVEGEGDEIDGLGGTQEDPVDGLLSSHVGESPLLAPDAEDDDDSVATLPA